MAHYAELNDQNIVTRVVVIPNDVEPTEAAGIEYCRNLFGTLNWRKTSYNGKIRKNYAGIGYYYDSLRDAFVPPRPGQSWTLDENSCTWIPPIPRPEDGYLYRWDEFSQSWAKI